MRDDRALFDTAGGPGKWATRLFSGGRNLGSTVDGKPLIVSNVKKLEDAMIVSRPVAWALCGSTEQSRCVLLLDGGR